MALERQSRIISRPYPYRRRARVGFFTGVYLGFCSAIAGFLALWPLVSERSLAPSTVVGETVAEEKIAYAGLSIVPQDAARPVKKLYTDRIEPALGAVSKEKRGLEPQKRTALKVRPTGSYDKCKPGRTRNAKGQCGRWNTPRPASRVMVRDVTWR